jgi:hypothetical protein
MLENLADNAEKLRNVSVGLRQNPGAAAAYHVIVQQPAVLTDIMLAEQMRRLPPGGKYSISSNPGAWHATQLEELQRASREAVESGVLIRRIFVLAHGDGPHSLRFSPEARKIITAHLEDAVEWTSSQQGRYEIKILDAVFRNQIRQFDTGAVDFIFTTHFGVFEWPGAKHAVQVQVSNPDLSDLTITGLRAESTHLRNFESVWRHLPTITPQIVKECLTRWEKRNSEKG